MEKLTITEQNYKGYVELFNVREESFNQNKVKNIKIYAGIFALSIGVGIAIGVATNIQIGLTTSLFLGGWGVLIRKKIEERESKSLKIDEKRLNQIKEKYPSINPNVDEDLLYLALEQEGMLIHTKKSPIYALAENFKKKNNTESNPKALCK